MWSKFKSEIQGFNKKPNQLPTNVRLPSPNQKSNLERGSSSKSNGWRRNQYREKEYY